MKNYLVIERDLSYDIIQYDHGQLKLEGQLLKQLGMFLDKLGSLHKVDLAISFDEVVTDRMNVINDDKLNVFLLNSLLKV